CVVDDRGVDDVLRGPDGALAAMPAGGIVMVHSTTHPDTCRRLDDDFPHLHVLDAPVSGGGARAAAGQLLVMVGGDAETLDRARPILDTFAYPLIHLGPLGAGQAAKLLNNALFAATLALAADAHAVGRDHGLDPASLAAVLAHGSGRSYAAELVAALGYGLSALASSAGPLLTKDVGILADVLTPPTPLLITVAHAALDAMDLERGRRKDLP
ncbi:NAD-binding protein, partial [Frankia sp. AgB1.9]|uniref:NAD(P)-binding domain-containing protein n=1 Tax=unclassified Frankia TaxID=2632575 RepID=UPI0019320D02